MPCIPWSRCGDGGSRAVKNLRKHARISLKAPLIFAPRAFLQFLHHDHTASPLAGWVAFVPRQWCDRVEFGGASLSVRHAGRVAGAALAIRSGLCRMLRGFALQQPGHSIYRSTSSKQGSGVHRGRPKIEVFYRTEPLCTENLPHRPSTAHLRQNRHSLFHSNAPMLIRGYCPIKSENSAQTGAFAVSSRLSGSQGLPERSKTSIWSCFLCS